MKLPSQFIRSCRENKKFINKYAIRNLYGTYITLSELRRILSVFWKLIGGGGSDCYKCCDAIGSRLFDTGLVEAGGRSLPESLNWKQHGNRGWPWRRPWRDKKVNFLVSTDGRWVFSLLAWWIKIHFWWVFFTMSQNFTAEIHKTNLFQTDRLKPQ